MDEIITKKCKKCGAEFKGRRCKACKATWAKKDYAAHPEKASAHNRKCRVKYLDERRAQSRKYSAEHREEFNTRGRKYRIEYPEKVSIGQRKSKLLHKYGITMEDYDKMFMTQHGRCAICGCPPNGKRLYIDHDHNGGKVRGLLCHKCNSMLGYARDDVAILAKAQDYLMDGR